MKLLLIGDPHFDNQTPSSRIDDYAETSLGKLKTILKLAKEQYVTEVITTGDFFDKYTVSFSYLNELMIILKEFKEADIRVWSLIGNHDLPYNNMLYFKNTPLNVLFGSGLVQKLEDYNDFDNFEVYGIDFSKEYLIDKFNYDHSQIVTGNSEIKNKKPKLLVMHYATYNTIPGESIDADKLTKFDIVLSGHDHMYYKPETISERTTLLRPGSLLRRTKDEYNLTRDIVVYLVQPTTEDGYTFTGFTYEEVKLPNTKLASEIFKSEVFVESTLNLYNNKYSDLFNHVYNESEITDISSILATLPPTVMTESKEAVINYLKECGITIKV